MNWSADFAGMPPIELPDGRRLENLADCRAYVLAPLAPDQVRWESAVAMLLLAAEHGGPFRMIARIAFSRALHMTCRALARYRSRPTRARTGRRSGQSGIDPAETKPKS